MHMHALTYTEELFYFSLVRFWLQRVWMNDCTFWFLFYVFLIYMLQTICTTMEVWYWFCEWFRLTHSRYFASIYMEAMEKRIYLENTLDKWKKKLTQFLCREKKQEQQQNNKQMKASLSSDDTMCNRWEKQTINKQTAASMILSHSQSVSQSVSCWWCVHSQQPMKT